MRGQTEILHRPGTARYSTVITDQLGNMKQQLSFVGANRDRFRHAQVEFLAAQGYSHMVSLAWNRGVSLDRMHADLRKLHGMVDEKLLGRWFFKMEPSLRTRAVFVLEKLQTNPHCHSFWRVPCPKMLRFNRLFSGSRGGVWEKIVPSGTYDIRLNDDRMEAARYVLKEQHMNSDGRTVIWSDEFLRTT